MKYPDAPFTECALTVEQIVKQIPQAKVYQKYTCDMCNRRITMNNPNVFTYYGHCEHCNHITNILEKGCNYRVDIPNATADDMRKLFDLTGWTSH